MGRDGGEAGVLKGHMKAQAGASPTNYEVKESDTTQLAINRMTENTKIDVQLGQRHTLRASALQFGNPAWQHGVAVHVRHMIELWTCLTLSLEAKCQWKSEASTVFAADL